MNTIGVEAYLKIGGDPKYVTTDHVHLITQQQLVIVEERVKLKNTIMIFNELEMLFLLCGVHESLSSTPIVEHIPQVVSILINSDSSFTIMLSALDYFESHLPEGQPCIEMRLHFISLLVENLQSSTRSDGFQKHHLGKKLWIDSFNKLMTAFVPTQVLTDHGKQICKFIGYNFMLDWNYYPELKIFFLDCMVKCKLFTDDSIIRPGIYFTNGECCFKSLSTDVLHYLFRVFPEVTHVSDVFEKKMITNSALFDSNKIEFLLTHPGCRPGFLDWILQPNYVHDNLKTKPFTDFNEIIDKKTKYTNMFSHLTQSSGFIGCFQTCEFFYVMLHALYSLNPVHEYYVFENDGLTLKQHFEGLRELLLPALWFHMRKDELFYTSTFKDSFMILNYKSVPDLFKSVPNLLQQRLAEFDARIREKIRILYSLDIIPDLICDIIQSNYFPRHHDTLSQKERTYLRQTVFSICKSAEIKCKKRKIN